MDTIVEHRRFSLFNTDGRNNKFWNITLYSDDSVEVHFGPQGMAGQKKTYEPGHAKAGRKGFEKQIKDKTKASHDGGAYQENEVVEAVQTVAPVSGRGIAKHELVRKAVADIAKNQKNPELTALITYFADVNAHNIMEASGGKITYDASAGTFSTTQGVVTLTQVQKARNLLNEIAECADRSDYASDRFKSLINPYMALIPQKGLVRQMDFHSMFSPNHGLVRQNDMLDALESSYASVLAASRDKKDEVAPVVDDALFKVDLDLIEDGQEIDRIRNFYETTKGSHADVKHFAVKRCFKLRINHMTDAFKAQPWGKSDAFKQYNVWELFHGSKASNMLSILKAGFMIPPKAAPHVCGRLYGDGVYASDMSSKALRYSTGAWGGGGNVERKFMFLVKFAMGMTQRIYQPSGGFRKLPAGYDSCYAKAGQSGVLNNEMIVYSLNRIEPMRLIEFTPYGK